MIDPMEQVIVYQEPIIVTSVHRYSRLLLREHFHIPQALVQLLRAEAALQNRSTVHGPARHPSLKGTSMLVRHMPGFQGRLRVVEVPRHIRSLSPVMIPVISVAIDRKVRD